MQINESQLVQILTSKKGAKIVTLKTETSPKMKKTGNPYNGAVKVSIVNGVVNFDYEKAVNKQRKKEGVEPTFFAEERKWGKRISGTPVIKHNGKFYLEMKVEKCVDSKFIMNGKEIDYELVKPFLYKSNNPKQDLNKEVILRDFSLSSIKELRFDGKTYFVGDIPTVSELLGV